MSGRAPILWLIVGFGVWAIAFIALYTLQAVGCAARWNLVPIGPTDLHRLVLVVAYTASLAAIGLVLVAQRRMQAAAPDAPTRFLCRAGLTATVSSGFVTMLVFSPVLALSTCR